MGWLAQDTSNVSVLTDLARTPVMEHTLSRLRQISISRDPYISKISVQNFDVTVDDLQCHQLIVSRPDATDEEQRGIAAIYNFRICPNPHKIGTERKSQAHLCIPGSYTCVFDAQERVA